MNSFQRFKIDHLSPSALNLWRTSPGVWGLRYVGKIKEPGNAAIWSGVAVENGLSALLHGASLENADAAAHQSFDLNSAGELTDEIEERRAMISPMLATAAKWQQPGELMATQLKVEHWLPDIPIPVIGYLDFAFESGIDVDLKTTKQCPSKPRPDHVRQVALYRAARFRHGGLLYVTDKRHAYYEVDDEAMEAALEELRDAALSLSNFLARCDGREDVLRSLPVDYDHWAAPKIRVSLKDILLAG